MDNLADDMTWLCALGAIFAYASSTPRLFEHPHADYLGFRLAVGVTLLAATVGMAVFAFQDRFGRCLLIGVLALLLGMNAKDVAERLDQKCAPRTAAIWREWLAHSPAHPTDPDEMLAAFARFLVTESKHAHDHPRIIGSALSAVADTHRELVLQA